MIVNSYDEHQINVIKECIEFKNCLKTSEYNILSINGYLQLTTKRATVKD